MRRNWLDRTRPLWRLGNRLESFELRRFGTSTMSLLNRGEVLLLETAGRRTGKPRFAPLGYLREDEAYVVGGGAAGMATEPDWVKNLRHDPRAAVWVRRTRRPVLAQELQGEERRRARDKAAAVWSGVQRYERKSGRVIPYFRLVPAVPDPVPTQQDEGPAS